VIRQIRERGGNAIAVQGDLTHEEDAAHLIRRALEQFERLDVLIVTTWEAIRCTVFWR